MRLKLWLSLLGIVILGACQQAPTKVFQSAPTQAKKSSAGEFAITEQTVIVDARPAFEYSVSHLNGSIPLRPEDFTQREEKYRGLLETDHFSLARRLARLGIAPETPVIVVGRGLQGQGEEGRMAWTLRRLGVRSVKFASIDYFSIPLSSAEAPPRANVPMWKPQEEENLEVTRREFVRAFAQARNENSPVIIDVRLGEEYLGKVSSSKTKTPPDIGAVNIPWTEFFRQNGLVNESVRARLQAIGVTPERRIFVVSYQGQRSAAVTMALRELGYSKAANFAGGYVELMAGKF